MAIIATVSGIRNIARYVITYNIAELPLDAELVKNIFFYAPFIDDIQIIAHDGRV